MHINYLMLFGACCVVYLNHHSVVCELSYRTIERQDWECQPWSPNLDLDPGDLEIT